MGALAFEHHPARIAAIVAGERRFDIGAPCVNGHHSPRSVANGHCIECDRLFDAARRKAVRKPKPKTGFQNSERNRRRNELAAQERRKILDDRAYQKTRAVRRALLGFGQVMQSAEARARSDYLNQKLRQGWNDE